MCSCAKRSPVLVVFEQDAESISEHNRIEAETAMANCRRLQREKAAAVDALKIKHRHAMKQQRKQHCQQILKKNAILKKMKEDASMARHKFLELLDEVLAYKKDNRLAEKTAIDCQMKATSSARHLRDLRAMCNDLTDELKDEQASVEELEEKQEEYENVIDYMNNEYESKIKEYKGIIEFMDHYYENEIENLSPSYVKKHWVKNVGRGNISLVTLSLSP